MVRLAVAGIGDDDEERLRRFLPNWQKNSQLLLLGNKDGKVSYLDVSFLDPYDYWKKSFGAFTRSLTARDDAEAMERITGHRPVSCPWRAYYDPLVREVMALSWAVDDGNLAAATGDDPPAILLDAVGMYRQSMSATLAEDRRLAEEERKSRG